MISPKCTPGQITPAVESRARKPMPKPDRKDPRWNNIYTHRSGYLVQVTRSKEHRFAVIAFSEHGENSFLVAQATRDAFLASMGPNMERVHPVRIQRKTCSNTGYVGISETVKWVRSRSINGFLVLLPGGKPQAKRVYYGPLCRSREQALKIAIKMRADWDAKRVKGGVL
jgi:hypothetical protein